MNTPFSDALAHAVSTKGSPLVVGLDPLVARLPKSAFAGAPEGDERARAAHAILAFNRGVIAAVAPYACAVKPQVAFYEEWGPAGVEAFEQTVASAHEAGLLVIGDVKRGDIGSTAEAYVRAHLDPTRNAHPCDAVTINPYMGTDSAQPFLDACDAHGSGVFVLVRTSNPSAKDVQDLPSGDGVVHDHVAALVRDWGAPRIGVCGYSSVGAVVGATAPAELARLREAMPHTWLLVPGVGAQGGTAADVACAFDRRGLGAVINASRSVIFAFKDPSDDRWAEAVSIAARDLRDELALAAGSASGTR